MQQPHRSCQAHYWARQFERFGHRCRLMAPKFVAPFRMSGKRGKDDAEDAAAICEAVQRPAMRFVPVKSELAQSLLAIHAVRQGWEEARTACISRMRGLLSEFGIVLPLRGQTVRTQAAEKLDSLGATAGFHADRARRKFGNGLQRLIAPHHRPNGRRLACLIHGVQRENVLGEIDSNKHNWSWLLPSEKCELMSDCNPIVSHRDGGVPFVR